MRAATEWRERVLGLVARSAGVVVLEDVAGDLNASMGEVKAVVEEAVEGGVLAGQFSNDERTFITDEVFRRTMKDKLKDE